MLLSQQGSNIAKWAILQALRFSQTPSIPWQGPIRPFLTRPSILLNVIDKSTLHRSFSAKPSFVLEDEEGENVSSSSSVPIQATDKPLRLRPYQQTAIDKCLEALSLGLTRIGVSSPTGSGKTTMFMSLIPQIKSRTDLGEAFDDSIPPELEEEKRGRTLILVGSVELANQAEKAAKKLLPGYSIEVEQSKRVASGRADVTIATYQTLNNVERLRKFDPSRFTLVIVDEAHHAAAFSYLRLLHYFNEGIELPKSLSPITHRHHGINVPIIGFSATFSRPDQLALGAVFQEIVFHREIASMLQEGWLSPARSIRVECDLNLDSVEENERGDYRTASLGDRVNTPEINELIVRTYLHRAGDRRSTLVFCVDLKHVAALTQTFRNMGIDARSVSSQSDPKIRKDTIASFGQGVFPVLCNCEVLTEGTDIPEIDSIILARPTKSRNLLAQMVGRGLRLSPETGKEDCLIVDVVDTVSKASGLIVSPTLWGLTHDDMEDDRIVRDHSTDEKGLGPSDEGASEKSTEVQDFKVTFHDESDPFGVGSAARPVSAKISPNSWVSCGNGRHVLELFAVGDITIDPTPNGPGAYVLKFRQKIPAELQARSPFRRTQIIAIAEDLERAFQTGDKFAERRVGRELSKQYVDLLVEGQIWQRLWIGKNGIAEGSIRLSRYAPWRRRLASEKQLKLLMKVKGVVGENGERQVKIFGKIVDLRSITAGQVASYLCAASHGAATIRDKREKPEASALAKVERKRQKTLALEGRNLPLPSET